MKAAEAEDRINQVRLKKEEAAKQKGIQRREIEKVLKANNLDVAIEKVQAVLE